MEGTISKLERRLAQLERELRKASFIVCVINWEDVYTESEATRNGCGYEILRKTPKSEMCFVTKSGSL